MKTKAIRELRKSHGLDQEREWDIWRDGCEDGEYVSPTSPSTFPEKGTAKTQFASWQTQLTSHPPNTNRTAAQVTHRIDALIAQIKHLQAPHMTDSEPKDIILVAHGHLTRAFAKRWLGYELSFPLSLMMEPGGVGVLSYQHHNVEEPALSLGIGFPVGS